MTAPYRRALGRWACVLTMLAIATPVYAAEVALHGLLTVVAAERSDAYTYNIFTRGDAPMDAYTLRLSPTAHVNDQLEVFGQLVLNDASGVYVDGAYLQVTPWASRDLHLLAGKVPWPIGTWAPRTYADRNPLIGTPLMYQYHSTLLWYDIPPDADALLATAGSGQTGANYQGYAAGRGMPVVDDSYWDVGATLVGSARPLEYALGICAGTPGWGSTSRDENAGKTVLGRLGLAPLPGVRVGVSGAYGPYLDASVAPQLPPDRGIEDYHQQLGMADLELLAGHAELRAEAAHNLWQTPTVGDLTVTTGYAELKYAFSFGGYVAGRWDVERFGKIQDSTGASRPWDSDVTRIEAGAGFRFDRNTVAKLIYQTITIEDSAPGASNETYGMVAAQVVVSF